MDISKVPLPKLSAALGSGLAACLAVSAAGCGGGPPKGAVTRDAVARSVKREAKKAEKDFASIDLSSMGNKFTVDDEQGKRLLDAKVERIDGAVKPGVGMQGPVKLRTVKGLLYQNGKPQMNIDTPEATWDGKQFVTQQPAHAVTADGASVIDAQKAVWTAKTGHLALENAKLQALKNGKTDFTAQAPRAFVEGQLVTMPAGAQGQNPEGQSLKADTMRWNMKSGKLDAEGNVVIAEEGTTVTGQRLTSNTRLKRGRLTGGTRLATGRAALQAKN